MSRANHPDLTIAWISHYLALDNDSISLNTSINNMNHNHTNNNRNQNHNIIEENNHINYGNNTTVAFGRSTTLPSSSIHHHKNSNNNTSSRKFRPSNEDRSITRTTGKPNHNTSTSTTTRDSSHKENSSLSSNTSSKNNNNTTIKRPFRHSKSKIEVQEAHKKLQRRLQYSREVAANNKCTLSLHIDSITRLVVQNFRKVINCERCSLFLMDHNTQELYFKPIIGDDDTHMGEQQIREVKEIRFPINKGIAGWVATNCKILNIKDAYKDQRFLKEIDQRTNFKTSSILCMPIVSPSDNINDNNEEKRLLGVVQMLNKKIKQNKKTIQSNNEQVFFTRKDEETLERCCEEVYKALNEILGDPNKKKTQQALNVEFDPGVSFPGETLSSCNNGGLTANKSSETADMEIATLDNASLPIGYGSRMEIRKLSSKEAPRRRSSIASLVQFINTEFSKGDNSKQEVENTVQGTGVSEALTRFQFRSASGPQMSAKGQMQGDADFEAAAYKRKRMTEYTKRRNNTVGDQEELALSMSLWNISNKFKQLLHCERCRLLFVHSNKEYYFSVNHQGYSRYPITLGVVGSVLLSGESELINDAMKEPRVKESFEPQNGNRPRTVLCQPVLNAERRVIAVIELGSERNNAFTEKNVKSIEICSHRVSVSLSGIRDDLLSKQEFQMKTNTSSTSENGSNTASSNPSCRKLSAVAAYHVEKLNEVARELSTEIQEEEQRLRNEKKRNSMMDMTANEAAARFQFRSPTNSSRPQRASTSNKNWKVFKRLFASNDSL